MNQIAKSKLRRPAGLLFALGSAFFSQAAGAQTPQPAAAPLSQEQVSAFTEVVGDFEGTVARRLQLDPKLAALAAAAVEARASRKSTGTTLAIVGFTLLGVGDIAGAAIIVATPGYPNVESGHSGQVLVGLGVAVISPGVGLAIGIPGVVKLAKYSDEENAAAAYYEQNAPGGRQTQWSSKALTLPIVSFSF